ncbi:hypothetical protein [Marinobacter salexigens]|uniref:hypothetical protein n=1 Tax=Marinobacter salexigens TaxID=1925763 RepID=UPI000C28E107|nr:hypothetical protein [Marinobacter salexigens]
MNVRACGYAAYIVLGLAMSSLAQAELKPMSEMAMGYVTGQGFMKVENLSGPNHEFTRMTLNMDVETRVNMDDAKFGMINGGSDFDASHVALGHISRDAATVQYDGNTYASGEAVPFEAYQPYIELAETPDKMQLSGFRLGFGQARGSASSLTRSFSGNIGMKLTDSTGVEHDATLFDAASLATDYRATHIGINDGTADCAAGVNCAPLSHLQSIIVGADNGGTTTGFTNDFFIGFQNEGVDWKSPTGTNVIHAGKGVFINLPTNMKVDMNALITNGVDRLQTHQTDMGTRLF